MLYPPQLIFKSDGNCFLSLFLKKSLKIKQCSQVGYIFHKNMIHVVYKHVAINLKKMKKIITILLFSILFINANAQSEFDIRKVNWFMAVDEVVTSEKPLKPSKKTEEILQFDNVYIGGRNSLFKGLEANLVYTFKNKQLVGLEYFVMLPNKSKNVIATLTTKVIMSEFIFDALKEKGFVCRSGWGTNTLTSKKKNEIFKDVKICDTENEFVQKIEDFAKENNDINVTLSFDNKRSVANFTFYEFQNSEETLEWAYKGNLFSTIEFKPTYSLEVEMDKPGF